MTIPADLIVILVSILITPLLSWMKVETWSNQAKQRFCIVLAAIIGLVVVQFSPGATLDLNAYLRAVLISVGGNALTFQLLMKGLGIEDVFDRLKKVIPPTP